MWQMLLVDRLSRWRSPQQLERPERSIKFHVAILPLSGRDPEGHTGKGRMTTISGRGSVSTDNRGQGQSNGACGETLEEGKASLNSWVPSRACPRHHPVLVQAAPPCLPRCFFSIPVCQPVASSPFSPLPPSFQFSQIIPHTAETHGLSAKSAHARVGLLHLGASLAPYCSALP